jgi:outer membrane protein
MRKTFPFVMAVLALTVLALPASAQTAPRIGYINSQRLLAEAPGAREAQQAFERDMQGYQQELGKLEEQLTEMITQYQQRQTMLSTEARRQEESAIRDKQTELQQRAMELEEQAGRRQQELVEPIMTRIQTVIEQIRAEGNYALILDAATGVFVAADPALDLTDQVLSRLRSTASRP